VKLGYTLFYVEDVEKTMNFYSSAFSLEKGFLHESKQYGEMDTGETKIGFVTKEVEAAYKKAISAGAVAASAPKTKPWGQVVSYVRDCNGFLVEICSPMG
jgi:lactoylglutathione lyase